MFYLHKWNNKRNYSKVTAYLSLQKEITAS